MNLKAPSAPDRSGNAASAGTELSDDTIQRFLRALWQLNRRLKQGVAPVLAAQHDLDLRRYLVLQAIRGGQSYPKQLAQALDFPPTLLSRYLEQLTRAGLLERALDPDDSRRIRLSLTAAGEAAVAGASHAIRRSTSERLRQLDPAQLAALLGAIERLAEPDSATAQETA